jgi:hypothetical protein
MTIQTRIPCLLLAAFFSAFSVSAFKEVPSTDLYHDDETNQKLRSLTNDAGLIEIEPCVSWDTISEQQKLGSSILGTKTCKTNSCSGGCCRDYANFLPCDTANKYFYLPCICNALTQDPNDFVPSNTPPPNWARSGAGRNNGMMRRRGLGSSFE